MKHLLIPALLLLCLMSACDKDDDESGDQNAALLPIVVAAANNGAVSPPPPDTTPPVVDTVSPADAAVSVDIDTSVSATFNEAMATSSITTASFTLADGGTTISGSIAYDASTMTATFTPDAPLSAATTYTAQLTTAVTDSAGNALATAESWSFTTGAATSQWEQVGPQVSPTGGLAAEAQDPTMMIYGGVPFVGYRHASFKAQLHRYDGTDWGSALGGDPTAGNVSAFYHGPDFVAGASAIYMAYSHAGDGSASDVSFFDRVFVLQWTQGGGWMTLNGGLQVSSHGTQLANGIDDGQEPVVALNAIDLPQVAWVEGDSFPNPDIEQSLWHANVGVTSLATTRTGPNNRDTTSGGSYETVAECVGIGTDPTHLLTYTAQWENDAEDQNRSDLYVDQFNGTGFSALGGIVASDFSMGNDLATPSIVGDGTGRVYVAYTVVASGESTRQVYVSEWDGTNWSLLGGGPVSAYSAANHFDSNNPFLMIQDNRLFIAWSESDQYSGDFIYVAYRNLTSPGSLPFTMIGNQINVDRSRVALDPSLAYSTGDDYLYVAFEEYVAGHPQIFVKRRLLPTATLTAITN